jgi:hypothetical protein
MISVSLFLCSYSVADSNALLLTAHLSCLTVLVTQRVCAALGAAVGLRQAESYPGCAVVQCSLRLPDEASGQVRSILRFALKLQDQEQAH